MDTYETVITQRAVKAYRPDPLPEELVLKLLEAARMSQSALNRQPWEFVVVTDRDKIAKIAELSETPYLADAPLVIAVVAHPFVIGGEPWHKLDTARAVQNMMLVAWAEGVGSCWIGRDHTDTEGVKRLLNIPKELELLTVVPFGYPAYKITGRRKRRKALGEIAHWGQYGQREKPASLW
jgi:nitroreductase